MRKALSIAWMSLLISGCTAPMYSGPARPDPEVATLMGSHVTVVSVDEKQVPFSGGNFATIKVLPGQHTLKIRLNDVQRFGTRYSEADLPISFAASAGRRYLIGPQYVDGRWYPIILDAASREVMAPAGVKEIPVYGRNYNATAYGASAKNVDLIKSTVGRPIAIATFQAAKTGQNKIMCRSAGPVIATPSFEGYIENAFIDEFKLAGEFDASSSVVLTGTLEKVDFSSGMTDSNWAFTLVIANARNETMTVKSKFDFSGSFAGSAACESVAHALVPAVQKLIADAVRDPKFKQLAD